MTKDWQEYAIYPLIFRQACQKSAIFDKQQTTVGLTQLSDPNKGFKPLVQARTVSQVRNS